MKFYRRLQAIKAISFDLDDTLYPNAPIVQRAEAWLQLHLRSGYPHLRHLDNSDWLQLKRKQAWLQPALRHDVTAMRHACLTALFVEHGYADADAHRIVAAIMREFIAVRSDFQVPASNLAVLTLLAAKVPLVALTNGNVDTAKIGLDDYFQSVIQAGNGLRSKPHGDMFDLAVQRLGIPARHILHVGDHLRSDVAGARLNGYMAAWFNVDQESVISSRHCSHLPDIEISHLDELITLL